MSAGSHRASTGFATVRSFSSFGKPLIAAGADEALSVRVVDNFRRAESDNYFARFVQEEGLGKFEIPAWDQESLKKVRAALLVLAAANGGIDSARMFGPKGEVDPVQHLIGTAAGWGGNPPTAALYAGTVLQHNDGPIVYRLTVKDVPAPVPGMLGYYADPWCNERQRSPRATV